MPLSEYQLIGIGAERADALMEPVARLVFRSPVCLPAALHLRSSGSDLDRRERARRAITAIIKSGRLERRDHPCVEGSLHPRMSW